MMAKDNELVQVTKEPKGNTKPKPRKPRPSVKKKSVKQSEVKKDGTD